MEMHQELKVITRSLMNYKGGNYQEIYDMMLKARLGKGKVKIRKQFKRCHPVKKNKKLC